METLKAISCCCFLSFLPHSHLLLSFPCLIFASWELISSLFFSCFWLFFITSHYISSLQDFGHISLLPHYFFLILSPSISIQTRARQRIQAAQLSIDASALVGVKVHHSSCFGLCIIKLFSLLSCPEHITTSQQWDVLWYKADNQWKYHLMLSLTWNSSFSYRLQNVGGGIEQNNSRGELTSLKSCLTLFGIGFFLIALFAIFTARR